MKKVKRRQSPSHRKNKPQSLEFKDLNRAVKREIRAIDKLEGEERIERYKQLKTGLDAVFADGDISRATQALDSEKDSLTYNLRPAALSFGYATVVLPLLYSVPALAPLLPVVLPATGVVAVGLGMAGRRLMYQRRARELGLTTQDVKYARKMKGQHARVDQTIRALTLEAETQERLKSLRESFTPAAERPKAKLIPVRRKTPEDKNNPPPKNPPKPPV